MDGAKKDGDDSAWLLGLRTRLQEVQFARPASAAVSVNAPLEVSM